MIWAERISTEGPDVIALQTSRTPLFSFSLSFFLSILSVIILRNNFFKHKRVLETKHPAHASANNYHTI